MSILVTGVEMPTGCAAIMLKVWPNGEVEIYAEEEWKTSKAVSVPPHGRLIDADALVRDNGIKEIPEYYEVVCDAPTVIPAEEDET